MRKLIFLLIALVAMTTQAQADGKVVFTASAPTENVPCKYVRPCHFGHCAPQDGRI